MYVGCVCVCVCVCRGNRERGEGVAGEWPSQPGLLGTWRQSEGSGCREDVRAW